MANLRQPNPQQHNSGIHTKCRNSRWMYGSPDEQEAASKVAHNYGKCYERISDHIKLMRIVSCGIRPRPVHAFRIPAFALCRGIDPLRDTKPGTETVSEHAEQFATAHHYITSCLHRRRRINRFAILLTGLMDRFDSSSPICFA